MNISEGIKATKETKEKFDKRLDTGKKLEKQAREIDSIVKAIDVSGLDGSTAAAMKNAKRGYSSDFKGEMDKKVVKEVSDTSKSAEGNIRALEANKGKVQKNAELLSRAEGISEVGGKNAKGAKAKMESDRREYGELTDKNKKAVKDAQKRAADMSSDIKKLFNN